MTQVERRSTESMLGWYFAPADWRLANGDGRPIAVGATHEVEGPLELCDHGLHASAQPLDALRYGQSVNCCRVRLHGTIIRGEDKACATRRTYLAVADVTVALRLFAARCARQALVRMADAGRMPHADSWRAVLAAEAYARGEITDRDLAAAWGDAYAVTKRVTNDAARFAAWAAAWATAFGAHNDSSKAAMSAAVYAGRTTIATASWTDMYIGWITVNGAVWTEQNTRLAAMLSEVMGLHTEPDGRTYP